MAPWRFKVLDVLAASNTKNIVRERTYWDKAWTWDVDDPRLVNNPTPPDQLTLEVIFRETVGQLAKNCTGLEDKLLSHERASYAVNRRSIPAISRSPSIMRTHGSANRLQIRWQWKIYILFGSSIGAINI